MENEVKIREERFRSSIDNMIDPFIILHSTRDEHRRIVDFSFEFANASACSLFRLNKDHLNGMSLLENMPDHEQTGLLDQYIHVVETGRPLILDNFKYGVTQNGKRKSLILDLRANRLKDGLAVTWRNVTERIQTAAELAEVQDYLLDGIETERRKMARVLHDGPVQDLYAIDFLMHGFLHQNKDPEIACSFTNMQSMLHQVIETLQAIVGDLRPTALAPFGLNAAILSYVNGFYDSHQNIRISLDLDEDRQTLPQILRLGLFRIFQQVIQNIERHANASYVSVTLKINPEQVQLVVEDNGIGFIKPDRLVLWVRTGHLGLAAAFEQTKRMGGQMEIESRPGTGTKISVTIPVCGVCPSKNALKSILACSPSIHSS